MSFVLPERVRVDGICTGGEGTIVERGDGKLAVPPRPGFSCAILDGDVLCWGANELGQLGDGTREDRSTPVHVELPGEAVRVTCGGAHACAWSDEHVWCWGANDRGQLGVPSSELSSSPSPIELDPFPDGASD